MTHSPPPDAAATASPAPGPGDANHALAADRALIGVPGGARSIATPALVLDRDALDANIATMAHWARRQGVALRPHAKTHKSVDIAHLQRAAGAIGICAARLGEAEVLAAGGVTDILVTAPIVAPGALARAATLAALSPGLTLVLDDPGIARALDAAAARAGADIGVLIDVDIGLRRTGVPLGPGVADLAREIRSLPRLRLKGLQAYAGHLMHIADGAERRARSLAALAPLGALRDALAAEGHDMGIVTGGGTGTFDIDPEAGVFTELQVGSYVFMDQQYLAVARPDGQPWPFQPALAVKVTVISANAPGFVTTDGGFKAFATDGGRVLPMRGAPEGSTYRYMGDEQGALIPPEGVAPPGLGALIDCVVPHCDPTVNLYDHYHVVRGDTLIGLWPIGARGRGR